MKRIGKTSGIIDKICEYSNISQSIDVVLRGRKRKNQRAGRYILKHRDEIIEKLQNEIRTGTFTITGYREYEVNDGPKIRRVQSINLYLFGDEHKGSKGCRTLGLLRDDLCGREVVVVSFSVEGVVFVA